MAYACSLTVVLRTPKTTTLQLLLKLKCFWEHILGYIYKVKAAVLCIDICVNIMYTHGYIKAYIEHV